MFVGVPDKSNRIESLFTLRRQSVCAKALVPHPPFKLGIFLRHAAVTLAGLDFFLVPQILFPNYLWADPVAFW